MSTTVANSILGLPSIQFTSPNYTNIQSGNITPTWTVVQANSRYSPTFSPASLFVNNTVTIPSAGTWRLVFEAYFQGGSNLSNGNYVSLGLGNKTVGGVPTSSGYAAQQLVYECFMSAGTQITAPSFNANYSGGNVVGLVLNVAKLN